MDIVNQMIPDYSSKNTCDNGVLAVFILILGLAAVNARIMLKCNKETIPYIKNRVIFCNQRCIAILSQQMLKCMNLLKLCRWGALRLSKESSLLGKH